MSEKQAPNHVSYGEPVVIGKVAPQQSDTSRSGGCAPLFLVLALVGILAFLAMSPEGSLPPPPPKSPVITPTLPSSPIGIVRTPGPTATLATRRFPSDGATFNCQPGIAIGKTADVVHAAVRVRRSPGYVDKIDVLDSIHYMQTGDKVLVKGGPEMKDGLCWWVIEHAGFEGWTADHSREGLLLLVTGQ